jgi:drug/metabolite transporter (DMT)-like permease
LWSTGFISARLVAPHVDPLTFLSIRFGLCILIFGLAAVAAGARWPSSARGWASALLAGVLLQGIYLGGVFWAVRHGLPAGVAALIVSLQPVLTILLAWPLLGEVPGPWRWTGTLLGLGGTALVVGPTLGATSGAGVAPPAGVTIAACVLSMVAITLGTIWQKRTAGAADLRTNLTLQFLGALLLTLPLALATESLRFDLVPAAIAGLLWSVLANSVGSTVLLMLMIQRGEVAAVASLFYLVPVVSAVLAYALFAEVLQPVQIAGMALAAAGVAVANRKQRGLSNGTV